MVEVAAGQWLDAFFAERILGPLGGRDLAAFGRPLFVESPMRGSGFGLGFAVRSQLRQLVYQAMI